MNKHKSHRYARNIRKQNYNGWKKPCITVGVILAVILAGLILISIYTVDTVTVEGNVHYSNDEIKQMVMSKKYEHNSIILSLKYRNREIKDIPFIESMSVSIVSPHAIRITVYEKAMAGYVEYMGQYFYFDKDGTVVESSTVKSAGIPQIMGLSFDHIVLLEQLPVKDTEIFKKILNITQLIKKYEILVDKIYFDTNYNITLYFGEARVNLGKGDQIEEQLMRLKEILPSLSGKKGVLKMENYSSDMKNITFELDES